MKIYKSLTQVAVMLACCGVLAPPGISAATPASPGPQRDVALSAAGTLKGAVVNPEGRPLDGAIVAVHRNGQPFAQTVTRADGTFEVAGLRTGVHEVAVGQQIVSLRCWSTETAPPAAREEAVLVVGNVVRGQDGFCPPGVMGLDLITLWTVGAATGALVLSAINQADLNDIEDKLNQLLNQSN
jgi:hypothetical protein